MTLCPQVSLLEVHIHLALTDDVNFDHLVHMWPQFSTVQLPVFFLLDN